ncbi:serpin family protein [Salinifilum aidingensis]
MPAPVPLAFSRSLHRALAPPVETSFCWSPCSVLSALGLVAEATTGPAHEQLRAALGDDPANLRAAAAAASAIEDPGGAREQPEFAASNTLWADGDLAPKQAYLAELAAWPGGAVRSTRFRADPERARQEINSDVADTTRGLIPELLQPGTVDPDTVAALVNALYLKTSWQEAFDGNDTRDRVFHAPGRDRSVPMMHVSRDLPYAAAHGWQAVGLPALGGVEAVVLLPDAARDPVEALETAEGALTPETLADLLGGTGTQRVELALPRFEVRGNAELRGPLGALGVDTVFTPAADFTPLTDRPMRVSTAVHESVLRVDENGLEGAAATAAVMRLTSAVRRPRPIRVTVDRPFWFLVRHRASGVPYFLARVTDPAS